MRNPAELGKQIAAFSVLTTLSVGGLIAYESTPSKHIPPFKKPGNTESIESTPSSPIGQSGISVRGTIFAYKPQSPSGEIQAVPISRPEFNPQKAEEEANKKANIIASTIEQRTGKKVKVIADFTYAQDISSSIPKLDIGRQNSPIIYQRKDGEYIPFSEGLDTIHNQYKPGAIITQKGHIVTNVPILTTDESGQILGVGYFDPDTEKLIRFDKPTPLPLLERKMFVVDLRNPNFQK